MSEISKRFLKDCVYFQYQENRLTLEQKELTNKYIDSISETKRIDFNFNDWDSTASIDWVLDTTYQTATNSTGDTRKLISEVITLDDSDVYLNAILLNANTLPLQYQYTIDDGAHWVNMNGFDDRIKILSTDIFRIAIISNDIVIDRLSIIINDTY